MTSIGEMKMKKSEFASEILRVKEWAEKTGKTHGTCFVKTVGKDDIYGLRITTWAVRNNQGDKTYRIKCAMIAYEHELAQTEINEDVYFNYMGGYNVVWEKKVYSYYGEVEPTNTMLPMEYKFGRAINIGCSDVLYNEEDIKALVPEVKYFDKLPLYGIEKFVRILKKNPQLEYLYKNKKTRYLWTDTRIWKLSSEKQKSIIPLLNKGYSVNDALGLIKYGSSRLEEEREKNRKLRFVTQKLKSKEPLQKVRFSKEAKMTIYKYVATKLDDGWFDYLDYLSASAEIGRTVTDHGVLCPGDFYQQHDSVMETKRELDEARAAKAMRKLESDFAKAAKRIIKKYGPIAESIAYKNLSLKIADSRQFLVQVGDILHICVGVNNYDKKMMEGKCLIIVVMRNEKPVECCELLPTRKGGYELNQLRGSHNQDSKYHDKAEMLINQFIEKQSQLATIGG